MKWEALLAMSALFLLALWLITGPGAHTGLPEPRPGSYLRELRIADQRGALEVLPADEQQTDAQSDPQPTFRLLWRTGETSAILTRQQAEHALGKGVVEQALATPPNALFRIFNITSWSSMAWIALGLAGQAAFFARMALQWIVSERQRQSIVPPIFWHLSLAGGVLLFTYFVWRQDIVGVLGQTTGIVIYARNVRLLIKEQRRARRRAAAATTTTQPPDPSPNPPPNPTEAPGHTP
ncbi:MAG: lipid-A-disaccharide synthase N-terminal domain-containing protein [Phycisphaerales bacterium]